MPLESKRNIGRRNYSKYTGTLLFIARRINRARIAQFVKRLAQDERSGDRITAGKRLSSHVPTGPGVHPASYTMGTGSFTVVNRPGRGFDYPPHLATRLRKE